MDYFGFFYIENNIIGIIRTKFSFSAILSMCKLQMCKLKIKPFGVLFSVCMFQRHLDIDNMRKKENSFLYYEAKIHVNEQFCRLSFISVSVSDKFWVSVLFWRSGPISLV